MEDDTCREPFGVGVDRRTARALGKAVAGRLRLAAQCTADLLVPSGGCAAPTTVSSSAIMLFPALTPPRSANQRRPADSPRARGHAEHHPAASRERTMSRRIKFGLVHACTLSSLLWV